jgi:hypothetical protein
MIVQTGTFVKISAVPKESLCKRFRVVIGHFNDAYIIEFNIFYIFRRGLLCLLTGIGFLTRAASDGYNNQQ